MADSSPTFTAELLDIKPLTLRRWCEYHAEHLSPGTNPPSGQARRFTDKDLEILKHIKHLRSQGFNTATINAQLAGLTFAEVITTERSEDDNAINNEELAPVASQEGLQQAPALMLALEAMQRQIDSLQADRTERRAGWERDALIYILGLTSGLLLLVGVLAAMALWGGG